MFEEKKIQELERQLSYANEEIDRLKAQVEEYSEMYNQAAVEIKRLHSVIRGQYEN